MKRVLRLALKARVHTGWFILSCLLLVGVALAATLMTRDLSSGTDNLLKQSQQPTPHRLKS